MTPMRPITHRYEDPLSRVWLGCAERVGLRVERVEHAYASTDGRGTLFIATDAHLDPDDSLAQMIFHELCHSLVEGPESLAKIDWGLDNVSGADDVREHACLRLQAWLTRPRGLARLFAPTTDFRTTFWDALGPDPLAPADEPSVVLAKRAASRVARAPWGPHLEEALDATEEIARAAARWAGEGATGSLWSRIDPPRVRHASGFWSAAPDTPAARETCATCAFARAHRGGLRCLAAERPVRAAAAACERWEPPLDCRACGACCREAFDTIVVGAREPIVRAHPELVVVRDRAPEIPRPDGRCPALEGAGSPSSPYACRVYDERPRTCRDFERGSANCLLARRRVGLAIG